MLFNFLEGKPVEMVQFFIIPDRTANNKKVHDLFRSLSTFYASPLERMTSRKLAGALWWDLMLTADSIQFFCTVPAAWKKEMRSQFETVWPLCSISETPLQTIIPDEIA
jgi:hypothetical protein